MSFQDKYRILATLNDGESQSFRALEVSTGRSVLVHRLATGRTPSGQPDLASLIFQFLRNASAEESRYLIEMGEDEGRIFVVTADAVGCLDLRQWLQSATVAQERKTAIPPTEDGGPLEPGNFDFTRTFTTEALRKFSGLLGKSPAPAPSVPKAPAAGEGSPDLIEPAEPFAPPPKLADTGSHDFTVFWEKYYPENIAGNPNADPAPVAALKKQDKAANTPAAGPEVPIGQASSRDAISNLQALSAVHDRTHPPVSEPPAARVGECAQLAPAAPVVEKPAVSVGEVDISVPPPREQAKSASTDPLTRIPHLLKEILEEDGKAPPPASTPAPEANPLAGGGQATPPRRRPTMLSGFEVVFQSNKPRSRPTLSGVFANPLGSAVLAAPEKAAPTPAEARLPSGKIRLEGPQVAENAGAPAVGFPNLPGKQQPEVGTGLPSPVSPSLAQKIPNESEQVARMVSAPPAPPPKPGPRSAAAASIPPVKASPISPPMSPDALLGTRVFSILPTGPEPQPPPVRPPAPAPSNRAQPGDYTGMIENVRALAGPLLPLGSPVSSPAGHRRDANPTVPAPMSTQVPLPALPEAQFAAHFGAPSKSQPTVYVAHEGPAYPARRKRKVWVPILILSSLFVMTLSVLLFFALKH